MSGCFTVGARRRCCVLWASRKDDNSLPGARITSQNTLAKLHSVIRVMGRGSVFKLRDLLVQRRGLRAVGSAHAFCAKPACHSAFVDGGRRTDQCLAHPPTAGIDDIKTCLIGQLPAHFAVEDVCCVSLEQINSLRQDQTQFGPDTCATIRHIEDDALERGCSIGEDQPAGYFNLSAGRGALVLHCGFRAYSRVMTLTPNPGCRCAVKKAFTDRSAKMNALVMVYHRPRVNDWFA